jgi:ABC-type uncharacterized transport system involved in gliding motility auxiliary subunit
VRGRASFRRPFERVDALRRTADDRFRAKEQELEKQLRDTEDKLTSLQSKRSDKTSIILTPEQEKELDQFQQQKVGIRKQLRAVRAGLEEDINGLGVEMKVINIIVVPFVFALAVVLFAVWRRQQRLAPPANKENKP